MTPCNPTRSWSFTKALVILVVSLGGYYLVLPYGRWAAMGYLGALLVIASTVRAFVVGATFDPPTGSAGRWWSVLVRAVDAPIESGESNGN